jgi:hypothetical protein
MEIGIDNGYAQSGLKQGGHVLCRRSSSALSPSLPIQARWMRKKV